MFFSSRSVCLAVSWVVTPAVVLCVARSPAAPAAPAQVFHSRTDLVALDVSVQSQAGEFVPPLTVSDFLVLEDNVPQQVTVFSPEGRLPLAVALLVDHSQSMDGERLDRAKAAAVSFLRSLEPNDLVEILAFNDSTTRLYPLGSDHAAAQRATLELQAQGATSLYDALLVGLRDLERAERERTDYQKTIVILSDGEDTMSRESFEDVIEDARRASVAIDAISLRTDKHDRALPPVHELIQLASDTGGRAVAVRRITDLESVYEGIAAELRHQYRIGYVSTSTVRDGQWRRISVRTTKKDLVVRTRAGYYAPRSDGTAVTEGGPPFGQ
jgi:Ca-activated chloride channel family protein